MAQENIESSRFRRNFTLCLAIIISIVFIVMIRGMLTAVLIAAVTSALVSPVYRKLLKRFKDRRALASGVTILIVLLVVVIPLLGLIGIVVAQAVDVSQSVSPAIERLVQEPNTLDKIMEKVPFSDRLVANKETILAKAGEMAGGVGSFVGKNLAAAGSGTLKFFFGLFVMLYSMFFFLMDGGRILRKVQDCIPLSRDDSDHMLKQFVSVSRATLKGTLIIGIIQGVLAGAALGIAGIRGAVFWGTIMAVLSVVPGVGTALVWVPAVIYLFVIGNVGAAIAVTVWCAAIVGSADNVLRPRLVGKDAKMSDLMIMLSTLGGLSLFGALGIVIGPVLAALFVTVWDIYGETFQDYLSDAQSS